MKDLYPAGLIIGGKLVAYPAYIFRYIQFWLESEGTVLPGILFIA